MRAGQICKLMMGDLELSGWYMKCSCDNGASKFCRIGNTLTQCGEDTINDNRVDETMSNGHPERAYKVVFVMPMEDEMKALSLNVDDNYFKVAKMNIFRSSIQDEIRRLSDLLADKQDEVESISRNIEDLKSILNRALISGAPSFMYVYGRHGDGGREFCWRVPFNLESQVHAGSTVNVETNRGIYPVTVSRIERRPDLLQHKLVVSITNQRG